MRRIWWLGSRTRSAWIEVRSSTTFERFWASSSAAGPCSNSRPSMDTEAPERIYERIAAYGLPTLAARDGEKITLRHGEERAATVRGVEARRLTGLAMAMAEA